MALPSEPPILAGLRPLRDKLAPPIPLPIMNVPDLPCGVYRHYKGGYYLLLGVGQHTETEELFVVYVALTASQLPGPRLRLRPLSIFTDQVTVNSATIPRFTYVGHETIQCP